MALTEQGHDPPQPGPAPRPEADADRRGAWRRPPHHHLHRLQCRNRRTPRLPPAIGGRAGCRAPAGAGRWPTRSLLELAVTAGGACPRRRRRSRCVRRRHYRTDGDGPDGCPLRAVAAKLTGGRRRAISTPGPGGGGRAALWRPVARRPQARRARRGRSSARMARRRCGFARIAAAAARPAALADAVKAIGFRARWSEAGDALAPVIAAALADWRPGDAQILVTAGTLGAASSLRRFEKAPRASRSGSMPSAAPRRDRADLAAGGIARTTPMRWSIWGLRPRPRCRVSSRTGSSISGCSRSTNATTGAALADRRGGDRARGAGCRRGALLDLVAAGAWRRLAVMRRLAGRGGTATGLTTPRARHLRSMPRRAPRTRTRRWLFDVPRPGPAHRMAGQARAFGTDRLEKAPGWTDYRPRRCARPARPRALPWSVRALHPHRDAAPPIEPAHGSPSSARRALVGDQAGQAPARQRGSRIVDLAAPPATGRPAARSRRAPNDAAGVRAVSVVSSSRPHASKNAPARRSLHRPRSLPSRLDHAGGNELGMRLDTFFTTPTIGLALRPSRTLPRAALRQQPRDPRPCWRRAGPASHRRAPRCARPRCMTSGLAAWLRVKAHRAATRNAGSRGDPGQPGRMVATTSAHGPDHLCSPLGISGGAGGSPRRRWRRTGPACLLPRSGRPRNSRARGPASPVSEIGGIRQCRRPIVTPSTPSATTRAINRCALTEGCPAAL